jgi:tetratricopeptide (TPR) repeat protein
MVEVQQNTTETPESIPELDQLQARIALLRAQPAPSSDLIDALNAQAHLLSRVNVGQALALSKEAYTLARLLQHHNGIAISLARLSWLHLSDGMFDAAVMEAHEARFLAERLNDYVLVTRAIYVLAVAERMAGSVPRSEALWCELLAMARAHHDRGREADYLNELGVLFASAGKNAKALEHYLLAHQAHVALDDIHHIHDKNNIADVLVKLGRAGEALPWITQALAGCDAQWQAWRAQFLHTAGVVHMQTGSLAQARSCLDESLAISGTHAGSKETAVSALLDRGRLALIHNKLHDAISQFEAAITLAEEITSLPQLREAHKMLHRLYRSNHSHALADVHHEAMVQLDHQINTTRMSRHMTLFRMEAELDKRRLAWSQELMLMRPATQ